jgi:hypothetical protein
MTTLLRTRRSVLVVALFLTAGLSPVPAAAQGYLHANGIYIADGSNTNILLRGMGLGGWLVPEGYMLGTASFANSPTQFRNVIAQLVGDDNTEQFFARYRANFIQRQDIDSLARWGFNSVRLPMHYGLLSSARGAYRASGFAIIDSLLAWCEANRLYLILDLHCAPGGQNLDNISDYQGPPALWESEEHQAWTAEIWKTLAARYASRTWIGGYDLINETAYTFTGGNTPLRNLLVRITDSIRTVDRNHLLFMEGNWYATDFAALPPAWDSNMAWSFHKYWNPNDLNAIQGYINLRANTLTPLWLGESGENSNQWFADAIALLERYNIGWSWWTHKKIGSIACPMNVRKASGYDALLKFWGGTGTQPSVDAAVAALNEQADLFNARHCRLQPDFLDALFRQPKTDARIPYAKNMIPGTVFASNYDLGRNGIAYADADFQNVSGPGGTAYNTGYAYRNDGVDIEPCNDVLSNGYDVGWTGAGEFLAYTVTVQTGGTYRLTVGASSGSSGGTARVDVDGTPWSGTITLGATGGWQTWNAFDGGTAPLAAGTHDLVFRCLSGGFNVDRLTFALVAADVEDAREKPKEFGLAPNFPNPFNPQTTISYSLPARSPVRLTVLNTLGERMTDLVTETQDAGRHEVVWDGGGMPSGTYYCRLQAGGLVETRRMVLLR